MYEAFGTPFRMRRGEAESTLVDHHAISNLSRCPGLVRTRVVYVQTAIQYIQYGIVHTRL